MSARTDTERLDWLAGWSARETFERIGRVTSEMADPKHDLRAAIDAAMDAEATPRPPQGEP